MVPTGPELVSEHSLSLESLLTHAVIDPATGQNLTRVAVQGWAEALRSPDLSHRTNEVSRAPARSVSRGRPSVAGCRRAARDRRARAGRRRHARADPGFLLQHLLLSGTTVTSYAAAVAALLDIHSQRCTGRCPTGRGPGRASARRRRGIPPSSAVPRYVVEVHAVDGGDQGRKQDRHQEKIFLTSLPGTRLALDIQRTASFCSSDATVQRTVSAFSSSDRQASMTIDSRRKSASSTRPWSPTHHRAAAAAVIQFRNSTARCWRWCSRTSSGHSTGK